MLKRFAAIFFILIIAGNAWGAVCGCMGGGGMKMPSCCKREKSGRNVVTGKSCCEGDCIIRNGNPNSGIKSECLPRIPTPATTAANGAVAVLTLYIADLSHRRPTSIKYRGPNLPRPPDLFIKNKTFLI